MSRVVITTTIAHNTGIPITTIRDALSDDPNAKIVWDGREVLGLCPHCKAILMEDDDPGVCRCCEKEI